jgi:hypothetical protein
MGFLAAFALLLCACYSPDIRDCTRACASSSDCVTSQICNGDHMCAAPSIASCSELGVDARMADGQVVKHDAAIDAPSPIATLMIHIDGPGTVTSSTGESCNVVDCTFHAAPNVVLTLTALPHMNKMFDQWQSNACQDQPAICHLTPPAGTTTVSAKFH